MKLARFFFLAALWLATTQFLCAQQALNVGPVHRYTFNNIAASAPDGTQITDTVGTAHGVIRGAGASFDGTGLRLTGGSSATAAYVDLPNGIASGVLDQTPGYASVSYEVWVTVNSNQSYSRIFDFGTNDSGEITTVSGTFSGIDYLLLSANVGTSTTIRFERGGSGLTGGATQDIANATVLGQKMHLVATYDAMVGAWKLYKNGALISTLSTLLGPDTLPDVNVWLGRSNWSSDANTDATYDEFRIYNYALSDQQVLGNYQSGPDLVTSTAPPDSFYKFDESSGTTSADSIGGNAVTLSGGASFVAGQIGNALSLDGTTGYGRIANSSALNPTTAMTIWAWINPTNWNGNRVIVQKGAANSQFRLLAENGLLKFEIASPTRAVTAPLPSTDAWSLVVATYDGAWMRLYVNGTEVGKVAATGAIPTTTDDLFIGASSATAPESEHFAGLIDDLRIYSRALTAMEINALIGFPTVTITTPTTNSVALTGVPANLHLIGSVSAALQQGLQWSKVSGTGTVTFSQPNSTDTTAQFSQTGTYVLQLTSSNAAGTGSAQVTVGVKPASDSNLALWLKLNESGGTTGADSSGNGFNATLVNSPTWTTGIFKNALSLSGSQYASLSTGLVSSLTNFSISGWVNLSTVTAWARIFDFGTGSTNYMFLTPMSGSGGVVRYAIKPTANSSEQVISGAAALTSGAWTHVAVTLSGTTGILYVNGTEVGRNSSMTARPFNLGSTTLNYLGKSQFSADPYLGGSVDDFQIYRRALSATEVSAFAIRNVAPTISCGTAPVATSGTASTLNGSVASEGAAIVGSKWTKVSGTGSAIFANSANPVTTVTFSRAGAYVLRLSGSNANAEVFNDLTVNVAANPNIYDDWINSAYPSTTDTSIIGPDADPDHDGISNRIEWALGLNPTKADAAPWTTGQAGLPVEGWWSDGMNTYLSLQVRRPIGLIGVTYSAEVTGDLTTWSAAVQVGTPTDDGDGSETVIFRDTLSRDQASRRYIRLKIIQP